MKSSFTTKRFFKDNNHYNVQFGCIGDAFFRAISILWTEEAIFEVEHQFTIYDVDSKENNTSNQIETRHFEINYCLKNIVYSYDYMNCLIRFIDAPGSNHPEATIRDFIAAMKSPNMNAINNISYCIRQKVECVSFSLISSHFIETVLFCSYVYWIIRYLMNDDKKYKKYALYFVDELCEQSGLDRKYAKEHHLFKLFEPMLNTFSKELNNPIKSNFETVSSSGEQEVSEEHVSKSSTMQSGESEDQNNNNGHDEEIKPDITSILKYCSDPEKCKTIVQMLSGCETVDALKSALISIDADGKMIDMYTMDNLQFCRDIIPLIGYQTNDTALKQVIHRLIKS